MYGKTASGLLTVYRNNPKMKAYSINTFTMRLNTDSEIPTFLSYAYNAKAFATFIYIAK